MPPLPGSFPRDPLLHELRQCAGCEDLSGAMAAAKRLAALPGDEVPAAMVRELISLDAVDLSEDAGDEADALYRTRQALEKGLVLCGPRAASWLRPLIQSASPAEAGMAAQVALRILAELGDPAALPVARSWLAKTAPEAHAERLAAIQALGQLRPPDGAALLRATLGRSEIAGDSWTKRLTAHALGRLGDVAGLELLLEDPDWFARLGAAEALAALPAGQGEAARARASKDQDPRVASAARPSRPRIPGD